MVCVEFVLVISSYFSEMKGQLSTRQLSKRLISLNERVISVFWNYKFENSLDVISAKTNEIRN